MVERWLSLLMVPEVALSLLMVAKIHQSHQSHQRGRKVARWQRGREVALPVSIRKAGR